MHVSGRLWGWMQRSLAKRAERLQHRAYMKSLLINLRDHPQLIGHESLVEAQILDKYKKAFEKHQTLLVDSRAQTHLQVACLVGGAYRTLLPWFGNDQEKVIEIIRKPLGESAAGLIGALQKVALFLSIDKFSFVSRSLKYMESDFGKSFLVSHHIVTKYHRASVKRCLYHSVFTTDGVPELTSIFCALDRMWFDNIRPRRHGIQFSRPSTLADGKTSCEFIIQASDAQKMKTGRDDS